MSGAIPGVCTPVDWCLRPVFGLQPYFNPKGFCLRCAMQFNAMRYDAMRGAGVRCRTAAIAPL